MIVCVSGAVFITGCGELSGMETAAGTEAAASEMTAETVSESQEEEKAVQEEKPRLVENEEEKVSPDRALVKANRKAPGLRQTIRDLSVNSIIWSSLMPSLLLCFQGQKKSIVLDNPGLK